MNRHKEKERVLNSFKIPRKKKKWLKNNPMLPVYYKGWLLYYSSYNDMWIRIKHHEKFFQIRETSNLELCTQNIV